jgi:hypothetical protein
MVNLVESMVMSSFNTNDVEMLATMLALLRVGYEIIEGLGISSLHFCLVLRILNYRLLRLVQEVVLSILRPKFVHENEKASKVIFRVFGYSIPC